MEPNLCLDTNVLIDFLKKRSFGNYAVKKAIQEYYCSVTVITVYELMFGVARAKKEIGEQALLGVMTVLPLNNQVAKQSAALHAELIRRNQDIGVKDVLIAGICLEYDLPILTSNEGHFTRVPNLQVIAPKTFLETR